MGAILLLLKMYLCIVELAFLCQHPECLSVNMVAGITNKILWGKIFFQSFSFILCKVMGGNYRGMCVR